MNSLDCEFQSGAEVTVPVKTRARLCGNGNGGSFFLRKCLLENVSQKVSIRKKSLLATERPKFWKGMVDRAFMKENQSYSTNAKERLELVSRKNHVSGNGHM